MSRQTTTLAVLTMGLALAATVGIAQAQPANHYDRELRDADRYRPGTWEHVDILAVRLEQLARALHDNVHRHLEGHPQFHHLDEHAQEIEELAEHIHHLAHEGQSVRHLREDVIELDNEVHHARDVVGEIARQGVLSHHFHGAIYENRRIVDEMNAILHHLEDDLARLDPGYRRAGYHDPHDDYHDHRRPADDYHDRYPGRGYDRYRHEHSPYHW